MSDDKKSAMDIEHATTRTLGEVNYDLKKVEQQMEEVKQKMQAVADAFFKADSETDKKFIHSQSQGLQTQLEGLQDDKKAFLAERRILMQQPTAQSAPSSGNQFITPFTDTLILRPPLTHTHHSLYTPPLS